MDKGADLNGGGDGGLTALHYAAAEGNTRMAELLLARGAQVDARDRNGQTPLHLAAQDNYGTPLFLQARDGYQKVVELLLAHGADMNAKDDKGKTPLALAAQNGRVGTVNLLKQRGAKE